MRMTRPAMHLHQSPAHPKDRGRLLTADEIARDILRDERKRRWVVANIPNRVVVGTRTIRWWERDVYAYLDSLVIR